MELETGQGKRVGDSTGDPVWPPGGNRVVFFSWRGKAQDLWTFDVRTRKPQQFTDDGDLEGDPRWSPDGKQVVFPVNRLGRQLWLCDNP